MMMTMGGREETGRRECIVPWVVLGMVTPGHHDYCRGSIMKGFKVVGLGKGGRERRRREVATAGV